MKRLQLKVFANSSLDVLLGNGVIVKGLDVCKYLPFHLGSNIFTSDFISLELGAVDLELGIQWLETLGKCEIDWKKHELSFAYQGKRVTLFGDPSLHCAPPLFQSLYPFFSTGLQGREALEASTEVPTTLPDIPLEVSQLLEQFATVFELPTQLPPFRGI